MSHTHYAENWQAHVMGIHSGNSAFHVFEEDEKEISVIDKALQELANFGILQDTSYDYSKFTALREAIKNSENSFEIPWTGISPRMQRLIYAINAINKPQAVVCAGIFCGYTFICNIGAAIGPGACYQAKHLYGFEILEKEAERARKNIGTFDVNKESSILSSDIVEWFSSSKTPIDLLYIDAKPVDWDKSWRRAEESSEYYKIVKGAMQNLAKGSLIVAHNSMNAADYLSDYLEFVRSPDNFSASVNLAIDDSGLEVTLV